jgi:hypothetical protein
MIFVKKFKGRIGYDNTPFDGSTPKLLRNCRQYVSLKEQNPGHVLAHVFVARKKNS